MGQYAEQEGPYWRTATFDGAGGVTYTVPSPDGSRVIAHRGRYWVFGDTVRASFGDPRRLVFALIVVQRGDSLIVWSPERVSGPRFPPLVRVRPVE